MTRRRFTSKDYKQHLVRKWQIVLAVAWPLGLTLLVFLPSRLLGASIIFIGSLWAGAIRKFIKTTAWLPEEPPEYQDRNCEPLDMALCEWCGGLHAAAPGTCKCTLHRC